MHGALQHHGRFIIVNIQYLVLFPLSLSLSLFLSLLQKEIQYEFQYDDEMWLKKHTRWGVGGIYEGQLKERDIEYIIDTLEKLHPMHLPVRHIRNP